MSNRARSSARWVAMSGGVAAPFTVTIAFFHQIPLAEAKGWSTELVASGLTLFAVGHVAGLVSAGPLVDRLTAARLFVPSLLPLIAAMAVLALFDGTGAALAGTAGAGVGRQFQRADTVTGRALRSGSSGRDPGPAASDYDPINGGRPAAARWPAGSGPAHGRTGWRDRWRDPDRHRTGRRGAVHQSPNPIARPRRQHGSTSQTQRDRESEDRFSVPRWSSPCCVIPPP
jgi:hypothetical protein